MVKSSYHGFTRARDTMIALLVSGNSMVGVIFSPYRTLTAHIGISMAADIPLGG